ncbi:MAG: hypothetical protein VB051_05435 [Candidatus Pelethousia sp.]|nr:hypothetical protein [Candidatus Pelethousia sp.]
MRKDVFRALFLGIAAALLLSGCGPVVERQATVAPIATPVQAAATPARSPAPTMPPTPKPAFTALPLKLDTAYTFYETTYILTIEALEDDSPWPATRLFAEEENGWQSAVNLDGDFESAYYCETTGEPCFLISTDLGIGDSTTTYVLNANSLAEADSIGGYIERIDGAVITIAGYVDMLGTYAATRDYTIGSELAFEAKGEGLFYFTENDRFLLTTRELPVQMLEGEAYVDEALPAGTELCVTATDAESDATVYFKTRDGRAGRLVVSREPDWVFLIDGIEVEEYFEELPYAG